MYLSLKSFVNLRIFLTINYLKRSETQIVNSLTVSRLRAFLFYVDLACPDYLGLRLFYIINLLFVVYLRKSIFCVDLVFPGYLRLGPFQMIDSLTVARLRNSNMIKNFKTRQ